MVADVIRAQALQGTPNNPGVPAALAELLVAQSKHETGNYTSNLFRSYNNAFGYSFYSGSDYQTGPGSIADNGQPIAAYASVNDSTMEMVDWLYRRYRQGKIPALTSITTPEQYAAALKSANYYGDSYDNYLAGLKRFIAPLAVVSGVGLLAAAVVLFILYKN